MKISILKMDNLEDYLLGIEKMVVLFGLNTCGVCKLALGKLRKLAANETDTNMIFLFVDVNSNPNSARMGKLSIVPSFVTYYKGRALHNAPGYEEPTVDNMYLELKAKIN